jgi:hypothetical protein
MMSNAVEITRVDSLAEDKAWLDGEYDRFHDMAIGNSVREAIAEPRAGTGEVAETQSK